MTKIAVYGTLRTGQGNNACMLGSPSLGFSKLKGFSMVSLGGFPAIDTDPDGEVLVEVFECSQEAEDRCNRLEGYDPNSDNNTFYDRMTVQTDFGEAEVYYMPGILGDPTYDRIESGDWCEYRMGSSRSIYDWT